MVPTVPRARGFFLSLLVAFIPAAVAGLLLHDIIKQVLFESPKLICISLIVGGVVLLVIDRFAPYPTRKDAMAIPLGTSFIIGVFQCLALVPGVSRSGATIVGAMLMGVEKRAAAEFSFFLAIPTMVGAFAYDFYKNRGEMTTDHLGIIAIGFVVSFVVAIVVVKTFLSYVTRHGFTLFAWWRVIVGTLGLIALAMGR
jgi:undecaprenyl-diphosphatase